MKGIASGKLIVIYQYSDRVSEINFVIKQRQKPELILFTYRFSIRTVWRIGQRENIAGIEQINKVKTKFMRHPFGINPVIEFYVRTEIRSEL